MIELNEGGDVDATIPNDMTHDETNDEAGDASSKPSIEVNEGKANSLKVGYLLWIFGFTGAHRFYYGKPVTGTLWFVTLGLLGIGWLIDVLLIPAMDRQADLRFTIESPTYTRAWLLLTFLGIFGIHRMYLNRWPTGLLYFFTGGLILLGVLYDFWTLHNQKIDEDFTPWRFPWLDRNKEE